MAMVLSEVPNRSLSTLFSFTFFRASPVNMQEKREIKWPFLLDLTRKTLGFCVHVCNIVCPVNFRSPNKSETKVYRSESCEFLFSWEMRFTAHSLKCSLPQM
jgi:hypothetical protein